MATSKLSSTRQCSHWPWNTSRTCELLWIRTLSRSQSRSETAKRAEAHGEHRQRLHEAALAALGAEHGETLREATQSPVLHIVSTDPEDYEDESAKPEMPAKGLSHVFVNLEGEEDPLQSHLLVTDL
ncbi:hypothetical protein LTR81_022999 [Elasticomyces elasticus]